MTTIYATCPVCGQPKLRLEVWPDYDDMLICTCDNTDCKLSGFTITPDVYTNPDEMRMYGLTPEEVDHTAAESLKDDYNYNAQRLYDSGG